MTLHKKPIYAFVEHPIIAAVINDLFSFKEEEKAREKLDAIGKQFILSKKIADEDSGTNPTAFWIKGYNISKAEEKKGHLGNFAIFYIDNTRHDTFTIRARKIKQPAKFHPERLRPKHDHPNWGYPILRYIKKGKEYTNIDDANEDLRLLHEEFPDATIPAQGKLYIMIFGKKADGKSGISKYTLEIKSSHGGGFYIDYKEQAPKRKKPTKKKVIPQEEKENLGKFTSEEQVRKNKKGVLADKKEE